LNLIEALELSKKPCPDGAKDFSVLLACGFTPLHLQTFLQAHLRQALPDRRIQIKTGLFGDLAGNLERASAGSHDALVVPFEWSDLDARLGVRTLGGWQVSDLSEILSSVEMQLTRFERALKSAARSAPVIVSLPTVPLPPLFYTAPAAVSPQKIQLSAALAKFAAALSSESAIRILDAQALDLVSPMNARYDLKADLFTGFPYKLPHASTLAGLLADLVHTRSPKKGLITDLDDTLWSGILGEVGIDGVSWNLDHHAQLHGLYQQFLASLASAGVLIGVASKNDPAFVQQAFDREDLLLKKDNIFPFEVHWNRKSDSVQRILKAWNIGPEAVIFIDDSPMEVAEVQSAFPAMECLLFKKDDYQAVGDLLVHLREAFGKSAISQEDSIRLESLRSAASFPDPDGQDGNVSDEFLQRSASLISFDFSKKSKDGRAFELVNKTNQFNLNGLRYTESDWSKFLADSSTFILTSSYKDKYGPLGKIAVLLGKTDGHKLKITSWVMSCRAFSRRIEHRTLQQLFEKYRADEIILDFQATPRNGPLQDFLADLTGAPARPNMTISRAAFQEKIPPLFHQVEETEDV
jgi:FkbH-like protein